MIRRTLSLLLLIFVMGQHASAQSVVNKISAVRLSARFAASVLSGKYVRIAARL